MQFKILLVAVAAAVAITVVSGKKHRKLSRENRTYDSTIQHFEDGHWHHKDTAAGTGPKNWHKKYPHCGKGRQSPINVETDKVQCDKALVDFVYKGYDTAPPMPFTLMPNFDLHAVYLEAGEHDITISNSFLSSTYALNFVVVYFGSVDRGGAHEFDGKAAKFVLILVHWNSDKYATFLEAEQKKDGLVAVEINVEVGDPSKDKMNEVIGTLADEIEAAIKAQTSAGTNTFFMTFPLEKLLPSDRVYYKYEGSYPVPPCYESATWALFKQTIYATSEQVDRFHTLLAGPGGTKDAATRPVQPLNGRIVSALC